MTEPTIEDQIRADRGRALALVCVSRETLARLDRFVAFLLERRRHINLIADSTIPTIWTRHVADSLQLLDLAPGARHWVDLGSGGGFPGLVLAIALAGRPDGRVVLVESIEKKCAFLREAAELCEAPVTVHRARVEKFAQEYRGQVDVITARALAPLDVLLGWAQPLLKPNVIGLFMKGQDVGSELTEAAKYWKIQPELVPSKTSPEGRIVVIKGIRPKGTHPRTAAK